MILKALITLCVILGLASARPQSSNDDRYNDGQYNDGQYNNDGQYDNANQLNNNNQFAGSSGRSSGIQQHDSRNAYITNYEHNNDGNGNYNYNVSQSDGIYNEQVGTIENQGTDDESSRVYGYYGYPGPDGEYYYVEYVADKEGFRPAGKHIPPAASVGRVGQLGIPSAAIASLAGGGLG